jgi:hypothetical protein
MRFIRMSVEERHWRRLSRQVETIPAECWEVFGLIGTGYPNSLYKLFAKSSPKGRWWRFEYGLGPSYDPVQRQAGLDPARCLPKEQVVLGGLDVLVGLVCWAERPALGRGLAMLQGISNAKARGT